MRSIPWNTFFNSSFISKWFWQALLDRFGKTSVHFTLALHIAHRYSFDLQTLSPGGGGIGFLKMPLPQLAQRFDCACGHCVPSVSGPSPHQSSCLSNSTKTTRLFTRLSGNHEYLPR